MHLSIDPKQKKASNLLWLRQNLDFNPIENLCRDLKRAKFDFTIVVLHKNWANISQSKFESFAQTRIDLWAAFGRFSMFPTLLFYFLLCKLPSEPHVMSIAF